MNRWPQVPLDEAVTFLDSQRRPVKADERTPGPYPYYGANGQQGTIDGYLFDEPLVLLAEDGGHFAEPGRGIAYLVSGKTWVNNHAHVLRANSGFIPEFIESQLKHKNILPYITGTTRGKLTKSDASRILISKPDIGTQRQIADTLDRVAGIRRLRQLAKETIDLIIPALFNKLFGDPSTNPMNWPVVEMKSLFKEKPRYGTMAPASAEPKEFLCLRVANIQDGRLSLHSRKYVSGGSINEQRHLVADGDLLIARAIASQNHLGKCFVAYPGARRWAFDSHVMMCRFVDSVVRPEYVSSFLKSSAGRREFLSHTRNSAIQFNINSKEFSSIRLPLPPIELQTGFERTVRDVMQVAERQSSVMAAWDLVSSSVQNGVFNGFGSSSS